MSTTQAARPLNREDVKRRPLISVVSAQMPKSQSHTRSIVVTVLLILSLVIPIALNAQMAALAHAISAERAQLEEVTTTNEQLRNQLKQMQSAPQLAEKARAAGLVPAGKAGIISVKQGTIVQGSPAGGGQ